MPNGKRSPLVERDGESSGSSVTAANAGYNRTADAAEHELRVQTLMERKTRTT